MKPADAPISDPVSTVPRRPIMSDRMIRNALWGMHRCGRFVTFLNILALIGHFVRGRVIGLELLLYFPLILLGVAAIFAGAAIRGLGARKEGSSIVLLGVASVIVSLWWMIGRAPIPPQIDAGSGRVVRLLHWNVLWGGFNRVGGGWASIVDEIVSHRPDVVVLSEAAPLPMRRRLLDRLGEGWTETAIGSRHSWTPYQYRLAVLSRWPTRLASRPAVRNGTACEVIVDHPARPIRILAIDGQSKPTIPRSMMLEDIAAICDRSAESASGPVDVIAGDFNCVGRTRDFDLIRAAGPGYSLASESSDGWRATWPSWLPVYDIDHVWVRDSVAIRSCSLFTRFASDHRGQIVELGLPVKP